ncbi:MAG: DUF6516 family protein [Anaerolineae bacterium]
MDPQLLELALIFEQECRYVISVERLPTKVRFILVGGYNIDLFYRSKTGSYSYTVFKAEQRVIGWDNAPHYRELENFPHHFHREDSTPVTSALSNIPIEDIVIVAREVNRFIENKLSEVHEE